MGYGIVDLRSLQGKQIAMENVGATGDQGNIGSEEGEGGRPKLEMDPDKHYQIGNVSSNYTLTDQPTVRVRKEGNYQTKLNTWAKGPQLRQKLRARATEDEGKQEMDYVERGTERQNIY
ncbi:hypothetical protein K438DRAFT_1781397 [Mycena galopus ATCC 62051]|nr:hypothetical protein K438DRAFT_1781397 [Mycena galopus ATCC 62051]